MVASGTHLLTSAGASAEAEAEEESAAARAGAGAGAGGREVGALFAAPEASGRALGPFRGRASTTSRGVPRGVPGGTTGGSNWAVSALRRARGCCCVQARRACCSWGTHRNA